MTARASCHSPKAAPGGILSCDPPIGCGTAFELIPPARSGTTWTQQVIHTFAGGDDGAFPSGGPPLIGVKGAILGVTLNGGNTLCGGFGCGTVYQLVPPSVAGAAWSETVLHRFTGGTDGALAIGLTHAPDGAIYGAALYGGGGDCEPWTDQGCGALFRLTPQESVLYSLPDNAAGIAINSAPALGTGGVLYISAGLGGTVTPSCQYGCGTLFALAPSSAPHGTWIAVPLHTFTGADGASPNGMIVAPDGVLYGSTTFGDTVFGTVFRLTP